MWLSETIIKRWQQQINVSIKQFIHPDTLLLMSFLSVRNYFSQMRMYRRNSVINRQIACKLKIYKLVFKTSKHIIKILCLIKHFAYETQELEITTFHHHKFHRLFVPKPTNCKKWSRQMMAKLVRKCLLQFDIITCTALALYSNAYNHLYVHKTQKENTII